MEKRYSAILQSIYLFLQWFAAEQRVRTSNWSGKCHRFRTDQPCDQSSFLAGDTTDASQSHSCSCGLEFRGGGMDGDTSVLSQDSRWLLGSCSLNLTPLGLVPSSNITVLMPPLAQATDHPLRTSYHVLPA